MELLGIVWNEKIWLPSNITWQDIEPGIRNGVIYRSYYDIYWSFPLALLILLVKSVFIRYFFTPLGKLLDVKHVKSKRPPENVILEKHYRKCQKMPSGNRLTSLAKQTDLTEREIERWWRKRRAHDKATTLDKFNDSCWRCAFYSFNFILGLNVLWDTPWLWNFFDMFVQYPYHSIDNGIWWYYNITMAFYLSLSFSQFYETRRKDFWQMFIHHIITLTLISVTWIANGFRCGSLTVFVHDIADVFLEASKLTNYAKLDRLCTVIFISFIFIWIASRLIIFSRMILCGVLRFPELYEPYPFFYFIACLCVFLLVLHVIWTYMIFKVAARMLSTNTINDVRSSSENSDIECDSSNSDQSEKIKLNGNGIAKTNGHAKH